MALVTEAACSGLISSAAAAADHCGRGSSSFSASSSSSSLLLAAVPIKNRTRVSLSSRRINNDRGFGNFSSMLLADTSMAVVARASTRGDENIDDAGVIKDMELYLDDLSLEYDSVWDTKPAWCQPWTIVGTGVGVITASWLPFQNSIVTAGVGLVICFWWFSFLYAYPLAYSDMIAERRKMIENGSEDMYGRKRDE